ncbi:MAG: Coenzyme F420 hydrogenase/dehydrogenase, beta subunit C-terminal domain [Erysipelotrichales bacterium]|nr:Coenzyme F420 hydrogenase/dehydrogenase, beta subunit C-terminal domain [Erysipelotrichales bacterium]
MVEKNLCKSCGACYKICPQKAINMHESKYGFAVPEIDESKCINCKLCDTVCKNTTIKNDFKLQESYLVRTFDNNVLSQSRSGGCFMELAKYMIGKYQATVFGATLKNSEPKYIQINQLEDLVNIAGSKYVWCNHYDTFDAVVNLLKMDQYVLFSGLPCQVAGLKACLKLKCIDCEKLYTVDIVCHGCPSTKVYKDYIEMMEGIYKGKITNFNFRDKNEFGWKSHIESFSIGNKKYFSDVYTRIFYSHYALNNSCFYCDYKDVDRVGDFSLADGWGIEKTNLPLNDDKGASLVLVNNTKAGNLFNELKNNLEVFRVELKDYMQPALKKPVDKPVQYEQFWNDYDKGIKYLLKKYIKYNFGRKIRFYAKIVYYKVKKGSYI